MRVPMTTGRTASTRRRGAMASRRLEVPESFPGLELWLQSYRGVSPGNVAAWIDQSGNGVSVTQGTEGNQPELVADEQNGLPAVVFTDANDDFLVTNLTPGEAMTVFFVGSDAIGNLAIAFGVRTAAPNRRSYVGSDNQNRLVGGVGTDGDGTIIGGAFAGGEYHLGILSYSGSAVQLYVDDNAAVYDKTQNGDGNPQDVCYIGALNVDGSPAAHWDGGIGEVIVYNRALDDTEREAVRDYLMETWGLA